MYKTYLLGYGITADLCLQEDYQSLKSLNIIWHLVCFVSFCGQWVLDGGIKMLVAAMVTRQQFRLGTQDHRHICAFLSPGDFRSHMSSQFQPYWSLSGDKPPFSLTTSMSSTPTCLTHSDTMIWDNPGQMSEVSSLTNANLDRSDATKPTSNALSATSEVMWDNNSGQMSEVCKPEHFEVYVA
ncbi:hypothetical protein J3A83DRAFT_4194775 [Scleroderma citrinum]